MKIYNKLVRDKIPDIIASDGKKAAERGRFKNKIFLESVE